MYSIQEIRQRTTENINKLKKAYKVDSDNHYNSEYKNKIKHIQQKIIESSKTKNKKNELDLLLEVITDLEYLVNFKKKFNDTERMEQIIAESDLIAIDFGFLYLSYCLSSFPSSIIEDYINNSLSPLEIISHIFIFRTNGLYHMKIEKIQGIKSNFHQLINNAKVLAEAITVSDYSFEMYQELSFKLSKSLQSIYSCLFILDNVKHEKEKKKAELTSRKKLRYENNKAIEVLDSFVRDGDSQEQKETWEAIKPGLIKNGESSF